MVPACRAQHGIRQAAVESRLMTAPTRVPNASPIVFYYCDTSGVMNRFCTFPILSFIFKTLRLILALLYKIMSLLRRTRLASASLFKGLAFSQAALLNLHVTLKKNPAIYLCFCRRHHILRTPWLSGSNSRFCWISAPSSLLVEFESFPLGSLFSSTVQKQL